MVRFLIPRAARLLQNPLVKNASFLTLAGGISAVLGSVFWLVVARLYTSADVGLAAALISAMGIIFSVSNVGLHVSVVGFLPRETAKAETVNFFFTSLGALSLAGGGLFVLGLPFWANDLSVLRTSPLIALAFLVFATLTCLLTLQKIMFVALRSTQYSVALEAFSGTARIILALALSTLGMLGVFVSWGLAVAVAFPFGILLLARALPGYRPGPVFRKRLFDSVARFSLGNYVAEVGGALPLYLLPILVLAALGAESAAYYYVAFKVAGVLFIIPAATASALFAEGAHAPDQVRSAIARTAKLTLGLLVPAAAVLFLFGDKMLVLFGSSYSEQATATLRLMVLAAIPISVNEIYIAAMRAQLNYRFPSYVYVAAAILTIGIAYVLTPRLGVVAVGVGWLVAHSVVAVFAGTGLARMIGVTTRHASAALVGSGMQASPTIAEAAKEPARRPK